MYNYKITRLSYFPLCFLAFCSLVFFGELVGVAFAIADGEWMSVLSGAFLGALLGLAGVVMLLVFLFIFNTFAAIMGGLSVQITAQDSPPETPAARLPDHSEPTDDDAPAA